MSDDAFASAPGVIPAATPSPAPATPATPQPAGPDNRLESEKYAEALKAGGHEAARQVMANSKHDDVRRAARMGMEQRAERESIATIPDAPRPGADPAVRLRELEYMKAHDHVRYTVHGKAEHEALLAKQAEAGPQPVRVLNTEDSLASIRATDGGAALVNEWAAEAPAKVRAVQQSTMEMLSSMGDQQAQGGFMFGVSQLPGPVQTGFARELSSPAPENVSPAANDQVAEYQSYGVVEKWGAEAPMRVARAEARVDRMLKGLPAENRVAALNWFRNLPVNQRAAIVEQLSR
jgi:hypothetical protein